MSVGVYRCHQLAAVREEYVQYVVLDRVGGIKNCPFLFGLEKKTAVYVTLGTFPYAS